MKKIDSPTYHLPGINPAKLTEEMFGPDKLRMPVPLATPALIQQTIDRISEARDNGLAQRPIQSIIDVLDKTIGNWLDPDYHLRRKAEHFLPATTGYSPEMIREGLPKLLVPFRRKGLTALIESELGPASKLDEVNGKHQLLGPRFTVAILAGNIPAPAVESIIHPLLVRSACLVKSSSRDPTFPALFARSIEEVDPTIGAAVAVLWWKGNNVELGRTALSQAEAIIAYGRPDTISKVRTLAQSNARISSYGQRISFAIVGRNYLTAKNLPTLAREAAWDISFFDQQGCVAPQAIYIERGGQITPQQFAHSLARGLTQIDHRLPRGKLSVQEAASIQDFRGSIEARQASGDLVELLHSVGSTNWTIAYEQNQKPLEPTCLNRTIRVIELSDLDAIKDLVAPMSTYLQTVGVAVSEEQIPRLSDLLGSIGVTRLCPIGQMQHPPASWRHDGYPNILPMLRFFDIEKRSDAKPS